MVEMLGLTPESACEKQNTGERDGRILKQLPRNFMSNLKAASHVDHGHEKLKHMYFTFPDAIIIDSYLKYTVQGLPVAFEHVFQLRKYQLLSHRELL